MMRSHPNPSFENDEDLEQKRMISKQCADTCPLWSASLHSDFFHLKMPFRSALWCARRCSDALLGRLWPRRLFMSFFSKASSLSSVLDEESLWDSMTRSWKGYILALLLTTFLNTSSLSSDLRKFRTFCYTVCLRNGQRRFLHFSHPLLVEA